MVGFSGVYCAEDLQPEGVSADTLGRLEARGIHVMTRDGREVQVKRPKTNKSNAGKGADTKQGTPGEDPAANEGAPQEKPEVKQTEAKK